MPRGKIPPDVKYSTGKRKISPCLLKYFPYEAKVYGGPFGFFENIFL
jgi:hypothetical protein